MARKSRTLNLASALIAAAIAAPAHAAIEEVIVTARKKEEKLQDIPLAVTALSGEALSDARIVSLLDLTAAVPGLQLTRSSSGKASLFPSIRGMSQQELTLLSDPAVSLYVGDVPQPRANTMNAALFDIESIEVLKGPQGTLFGRNVTGGAIVVKPRRPSDKYEADVTLTGGNLGKFESEFALNAPLGPWAQLRVAGATRTSDGFIEDVLTGKNIDENDDKSLRVSLAAQPIEGLDNVLVYSLYSRDDGGSGFVGARLNTSVPPSNVCNPAVANPRGYNNPLLGGCAGMNAAAAGLGIYKLRSGVVDPFTKISAVDIANTTTYQITDDISIKNVVSWGHKRFHGSEDSDGFPIPLLHVERQDDTQQWTEEFQILGKTGNLDWIGGVFFFTEDGENHGISNTLTSEAAVPGTTGVLGPEPSAVRSFAAWSDTNVRAENTSYAVFAQGTYAMDAWVEGLSITAGIRYNWDIRHTTILNHTGSFYRKTGCRFTRNSDGNTATPEINLGPAGCFLPLEVSYDEPTWTVSLQYKFAPNKLVYLSHRHGYRTGGFGARASREQDLVLAFRPEIVNDVELGAKIDWDMPNDMALRTNVALYAAFYEDIQRQISTPPVGNPPTVTTLVFNAPAAEIKGLELEVIFQPTERLEVSGFYAYTDSAFTESFFDQVNFGAGNIPYDLSQNPLARAPVNVGSVSGTYKLPIDESLGTASVSANYWATDSYNNNDSTNPLYQGTTKVDGYGLLNLRADWKNVLGSNFDVGFYMRNATDREYTVDGFNIFNSVGWDSRFAGEPRTYGVQVRYRFEADKL
ncbi:MAG: TonB-dependent receptor [Gammaproteobacteria bacterium]